MTAQVDTPALAGDRAQSYEFLKEILGIVPLEDVKEPTDEDRWLIPGVLTKTNTMLYGQASVGKSMVVASLIASLWDGREFFRIAPLAQGLRGLVVCADAAAEAEYKGRLVNLGVTDSAVEFLTNADVETPWGLLHLAVQLGNFDYVVIDHATGVLAGDEKEREPWRRFWQEAVAPFNLPVLVVAHSSDATYEGKQSHRPLGNSAATQFTRCEVEVFNPSNNKFDQSHKVLRSSSRYGDGIERKFWIADPGVIVVDEYDETTKTRDRNRETLDTNAAIARRACESSETTNTGVAGEICAEFDMTEGGMRNKLTNLAKAGLLVKKSSAAGGMYSPGPKLKG